MTTITRLHPEPQAAADPDPRGALPGGGPEASAGANWAELQHAKTTDGFYSSWLALLCGAGRGVEAGLLLIRDETGSYVTAAIWPDAAFDVTVLGKAVERALVERSGVLMTADPDRGATADESRRVHIAHPILAAGEPIGAVAVVVASPLEADWRDTLERMRWGAAWPESVFWRQKAAESEANQNDAQLTLDLVAVADSHERIEAAAVLVANALTVRLACDRVAVGFRRGRGIAVKAMSHTAAFDRKTDLITGLGDVMNEAFDQRAAVAFPAVASTQRRIAVAHAAFAERWQVGAILSVLIKSAGRPLGVITLERPVGRSFDETEVRTCAFLADHIGPLLELKDRQQRFIGGRLERFAKETVAGLVGPGRPALKLASGAAAIALAILTLYPADFRIAAKSVLEGSVQRAAVAPFDGFVAEAPVRAGDLVTAGQEIARLDDRDLLLEKLKWETERQKLVQRQREAFAKHDRSNVLVAAAQIDQAESQLDLVLEELRRARITSPIDGIVVAGDLSQVLGTPVAQGKVLFEIAPLDSYRLVLRVDERDIGQLRVGQTGTLLLTGAPASGLTLTVTKITAVATAAEGSNFFRVEASLPEAAPPLRPGMEGVAKVDVGRRSLMWIWTRPLAERLRMLAWTWTP